MNILQKIVLWGPTQIYDWVTNTRNWLFDKGILESRQFDIPVICIGNLTVGGTGKTPHTEYLIRALSDRNVAVLSRGYKRKTKGFVLADSRATAATIGDEPYQIHCKFPDIIVAVDEKRVHGIEQLLQLPYKPDIILLDDAFQHRYVQPSYAICLMDYHRPVDQDQLLPLGRLRESAKGLERADCVIVTKCPSNADLDEATWRQQLKLNEAQKLLFSTFQFDVPKALFTAKDLDWSTGCDEKPNILVVTGIVSPQSLLEHILPYAHSVESLQFADHHNFTAKDFDTIVNQFERMAAPKIIITTEKDAARLMHNSALPDCIRQHIYSIGIRVAFIGNDNPFNDILEK